MTKTQESPDPEWMQRLLENALESWPEFDTDEPVNGGDLVDWFGEWRINVKRCLGSNPQAAQ